MTKKYYNRNRLKENLYSTRGNSSKRDIGKSYAETQSNFVPANFMNTHINVRSWSWFFQSKFHPLQKVWVTCILHQRNCPKIITCSPILKVENKQVQQKKGQGLATCIIPTDYCSDLFFHAIEPSSTMWTS